MFQDPLWVSVQQENLDLTQVSVPVVRIGL